MSTSPEGFEDRPVPVRPLDEGQARLLEILRAARGAPVSYGDLRACGIENPAVLCYELEIAGVPITHVEHRRPGAAAVPVGVQLDEEWFTKPPPPARAPLREHALGWRDAIVGAASAALSSSALQRVRPDGAFARELRVPARGLLGLVLAGAALVAALVLVLALGSSSGSRSAARLRAGSAHDHLAVVRGGARARAGNARSSAARALAEHAPQRTSIAGGTTRGAPGEGSGSAVQLQAEGHQLLAEGRYGAAAQDLRGAIAASGDSTARCEEPSTESCLTYAYALYDLGRALQAQNKPQAAVPILDERLRIDNQRQTVRAQLNSARAQMHTVSAHGAPTRAKHPRSSAQHRSTAHAPPAAQSQGSEGTGEQVPSRSTPTAPPAQSESGGEAPGATHGGAAGPPANGTND